MASVFGWWRALLAMIQAKQEAHWIEPSNEITRAILSGQAPETARREVYVTTPASAATAATKAPFVATPAAEMPEPVVAEPAAAAAEVPERSRRRGSHRAA